MLHLNDAKNFKRLTIVILILFFMTGSWAFGAEQSAEMPKPTYQNSLIYSIIYHLPEPPSAEMDYIKSRFGNGLYAKLMFTEFVEVDLDWHADIAHPDFAMKAFKTTIDTLVKRAKTYGVGVHVILIYGVSRSTNIYKSAKEEDIRNAQWYNDNNIAAANQLNPADSQASVSGLSSPRSASTPSLLSPDDVFKMKRSFNLDSQVQDDSSAGLIMNETVFGSLSRYARKFRAHIESKVKTAFDYLKKKQDENPDVLMIVSGPGEIEFNNYRINDQPVLQNFFCDYSPFSVLEFRDWIKHEGMYADNGKYAGQGYVNGGTRYQGENGLQNFNQDFHTPFTSWNLKYFNWSLTDLVDTNYTDSFNPDRSIIPFSFYTFGGQMPVSGNTYIAGGFDPPRVMKAIGTDTYYDLWHQFRENTVYRFVQDMVGIAVNAGFTRDHYYTHQIPGDYLFGTRPNDPKITLNERYYASGSPIWTAKVFPDVGVGVTMYDVNFLSYYARTSLYAIPAMAALSDNWAALEFNPEILPSDTESDIASPDIIYPHFLRLYEYNAHVVGLFSWEGPWIYRYKGTNRETAAKWFFDNVKDKARQPISTVFKPITVSNFTAQFFGSNLREVRLGWSSKIWSDLNFEWTHWGDFKEFILYRGTTPDFVCNSSTEIARLTGHLYTDPILMPQYATYYYKVAASNVNGETGTPVSVQVTVPYTGNPIMTVSRDSFQFAGNTLGTVSTPQTFTIRNTGLGTLQWTVNENIDWLTCSNVSGTGNATITLSVNTAGKTPGNYSGTITVTGSNAAGSPKTIYVTLRVIDPQADQVPFGFFETPFDRDTVQGSVPVTGWALDDIGIESVKIYRENGSQRVYIGDALFVEGVRPDVEAAYPSFPFAYRAGWGYMLLTNYLPNGGNGTFQLTAIATDKTGQQTVLGTRTIICNNSAAVHPFGAIDTPAAGEIVSGKNYVNFGWALTPMPNSIPLSGSTITVIIDGVEVGHPVYNNFREDVALSFPGYANSNGAVGYFYFDTTALSNGRHTIEWRVQDSAGNQSGIGSRYFYVQN